MQRCTCTSNLSSRYILTKDDVEFCYIMEVMLVYSHSNQFRPIHRNFNFPSPFNPTSFKRSHLHPNYSDSTDNSAIRGTKMIDCYRNHLLWIFNCLRMQKYLCVANFPFKHSITLLVTQFLFQKIALKTNLSNFPVLLCLTRGQVLENPEIECFHHPLSNRAPFYLLHSLIMANTHFAPTPTHHTLLPFRISPLPSLTGRQIILSRLCNTMRHYPAFAARMPTTCHRIRANYAPSP